ncbi:lytic murein transglycosylase [Candidatus Parcubacteria bacterium]|nr:lytic murein transglycosylase [Candidatus Parcubacteria bacterium]
MNFRRQFIVFYLCFSVISASAVPFFINPVSAQTDPCNTNIAGKSNAELQRDLDACNAEIEKWTEVLNNTKKNTASYATEVAKLTARINAAQATIKGKTIAIANLNSNISKKQGEISQLESKIDQDIEHIAELVRKTNQIDSFSVAEAILSEKSFSDFFVDIDLYTSTRSSLIALVDSLRGVKSETETQKAELAKQRDAEAEAKAVIEANKKKVEQSQAEQKTLLTQSQNQEKAYGQLLAEKQARAAAIRTALFGLRDSAAIPFGTALQYAQAASQKTGVRPALILGILQQESNLGQNVGTCVITNLSSGETRNVNTGRVFPNGIHPTRDLPLLQTLLSELGGDPLNTKVSCPLSIGYGGAMGPAQFIPSTWNLMKNRIAAATGKSVPDPWNPSDAIMAMALFLKDLGAASGSFTNERTAACRYYSGKNCYGASGAPNSGLSYGNSVMNRAATIQANIDLLQDV